MKEISIFFFLQAEDCIRVGHVTGVQTCALPISVLLAEQQQLGEENCDLDRADLSVCLRTWSAPPSHCSPSTEIGRASCRERVLMSVVLVPFERAYDTEARRLIV